MYDVRSATLEDTELLARIAATGFYDDPVLSWVFPDPDPRLHQLDVLFVGLVRDYLPDRGTVHLLDDACAAFWRTPAFDHGGGGGGEEPDGDAGGLPADILERIGILSAAMAANHPHDPHWYLNVLSTMPEHQGRGLGAAILQPVLAVCDADGVPAYLESSNPRNMTLYRRQGFEQTGETPLPDGPSLYPMWRDPR